VRLQWDVADNLGLILATFRKLGITLERKGDIYILLIDEMVMK
jgi:hypothetical protein